MSEELKIQSELQGKPTNFSNITCHMAKFENIKNVTAAVLPGLEAIEIYTENKPAQKKSLFSRIFGIIPK